LWTAGATQKRLSSYISPPQKMWTFRDAYKTFNTHILSMIRDNVTAEATFKTLQN